MITADGSHHVVPHKTTVTRAAPLPIAGLEGARVTAVAAHGLDRYAIGTSDGRVIPLEMKIEVGFEGDRRTVSVKPAFAAPVVLDPGRKRAILRLTVASPDSGPVTVAQVGPHDLIVQTVVEKKTLIGGTRREESVQALGVTVDGEILALRVHARGFHLHLGTSRAHLVR